MHIALTLPLGPAIVFQLIAATLRRTTLTDGKVFVGVHGGCEADSAYWWGKVNFGAK